MANKGLENYITVKERKQKFYIEHDNGRIVAELLNNESGSCLFKASCYKNSEDQSVNLPLATGYAQEFKGVGGFANNTSWLENCEESAVGRCLDNAGFSVSSTCSREEIEAAQRNKKALVEQAKIKKEYFDYLKNNFSEDELNQEVLKAKAMTVKQMHEVLVSNK